MFSICGALHSMAAYRLKLVDNTSTLVTLPSGDKVIFRLHQCILDRDLLQTEALLQSHQARAFGIVVDDCAKYYMGPGSTNGGQHFTVGDEVFPLQFDGWKCYF